MIKPADIKNQGFKKGLFGYKAADVDSFVNVVYRAYEECYRGRDELEANVKKLDEALKESRLKIFDLESQLQKAENASDGDDTTAARKTAEDIIKDAESAAAQIIAKAKEQSEKLEKRAAGKSEEPKVKPEVKAEPKPEAKAEGTASSKFFKKAADEQPAAASGNDDEIFVGEIEDARKPERMMIGDGEEEEDMDFEFL